MSQTSIRVDSSCQLALRRCACKSAMVEASKPKVLASCPVTIRNSSNAGGDFSLRQWLAVYDTGYILFGHDREELDVGLSSRDIALTGYDLLRTSITRACGNDGAPCQLFICDEKNQFLIEFAIHDSTICNIVCTVIQRAVAAAQEVRTRDVVFQAVVHEGLILLQKRHMVLLRNGMFALGVTPKVARNPKTESITHSSLEDIEFSPYGDDGRGMRVIRKRGWKKDKPFFLWFGEPEERADFLALVNFRNDDPSGGQCTGANMMKASQECPHHIMKSSNDGEGNVGSEIVIFEQPR